MSSKVFALILILFAIVFLILFTSSLRYREPYITAVYCLRNDPKISERMRMALSEGSQENAMAIFDTSKQVSRELDEIKISRPAKLVHGVIKRDGKIVISYSNMGVNYHTLKVIFFSKDYKILFNSFDKKIHRLAYPSKMRLFSGGGFDDNFCANTTN